MSNFLGEYLYIVQPHEEVFGSNNIYKFGFTAQTPNDRMKGYPKNSRLWMVVIMQNARNHESVLKGIFNKKYKQRKDDKGDEYYEVDNIQDMMNDLWNYHQQHFKNIFNPSKFNGEYYMMMRKDEIVKFNGEYAIIKRDDWNCCGDFVIYLLSHGWQHDNEKELMILQKDKYNEFITNLTQSIDAEFINNNQSNSNIEQQPNEQVMNTTSNTHIQPTKTTKQLINERKLNPVSIEHYVKLLSSYLIANKYNAKQSSLELNVSLKDQRNHELTINNCKLYYKDEIVKRYEDINELEVLIPRNENPNVLRLTNRKEMIFSQVYSKNITEYLIIIPSLEFRTGRSRRGKCEYLEVEFVANNQF